MSSAGTQGGTRLMAFLSLMELAPAHGHHHTHIMPNDGGGTPHDLVVQSWIMYGIGILFFIVRLFVLPPPFIRADRFSANLAQICSVQTDGISLPDRRLSHGHCRGMYWPSICCVRSTIHKADSHSASTLPSLSPTSRSPREGEVVYTYPANMRLLLPRISKSASPAPRSNLPLKMYVH